MCKIVLPNTIYQHYYDMQPENNPLKAEFDRLLSEAGVTRAELARIAGVTPTQVSRWNRGMPKLVVEYLQLRAKYQRLLDKI